MSVPLRFAGYAVRWDRVDRAGDVFRARAFADGAVPLLLQHRGGAVGRADVRADDVGLRVSGEVGEIEVADLVRAGALTGLSVGYRPLAVRRSAWREIAAAELVEVSLVAQPMQPGARIDRVG